MAPVLPGMDTVKAEKETAMRRYRRIRKIGRMLRCLEACAALLLLSWYSARLPDAARISCDFLRSLAAGLLSPGFVFVIGNAIVLALFAKSGKLSLSGPSSSSAAAADVAAPSDVYNEFLENSDGIAYFLPPELAAREEVYEDKEVCVESRALRRSRSAGTGRRRKAPELRRSESVMVKGDEKHPAPEGWEIEEGEAGVEDGDEFRRTIEEFIAKQLRFQREESMAVVSSAGLPEPKSVKKIKIIL